MSYEFILIDDDKNREDKMCSEIPEDLIDNFETNTKRKIKETEVVDFPDTDLQSVLVLCFLNNHYYYNTNCSPNSCNNNLCNPFI